MKLLLLLCLTVALTIYSPQNSHAQTDTLAETNEADSANSLALKMLTFQDLIRKVADSLADVETFKNLEKKIHAHQLSLTADMQGKYFEFKEYYARNIDTAKLSSEFERLEYDFKVATSGLTDSTGKSLTARNLSTSVLLIESILERVDSRKENVSSLLETSESFRRMIDSLQVDTAMYYFPKDSALFVQYFNKLIDLNKAIAPIDSTLNAAIKFLQNQVSNLNSLQSKLTAEEQRLIILRVAKSISFFHLDSRGLLNMSDTTGSLRQSFDYSSEKGRLLLSSYLGNNSGKLVICVAAMLILLVIARRMVKRYRLTDPGKNPEISSVVLDHTFATVLFLSIAYCSLIFPHPPVVFQTIVWVALGLLFTILMFGKLGGAQKLNWLYFYLGLIAVSIANLILKESPTERWLFFVLSSSAIVMSIRLLRARFFDGKIRIIKMIIVSLALMLFAVSVLTNFSGMFDLTKASVSLGFFMIVTAYILYYVWKLSAEFYEVYYISSAHNAGDTYRQKLERLKYSIPKILSFLLTLAWIILTLRHFYIYELIAQAFSESLHHEITVGDFKFSLLKVLEFISIIVVATIASKIISFIADSSDADPGRNSGRLSNWMLLIRIAIISCGILLAFAATGIPIDKLAIIIGSLGVGIGLGLQNVVNNLVSGVLLAFEKPFNIGDQIEVEDKSGRIKEIGIRSSRISTSDGAEVIVPNGDLLSKHVTNWTLHDQNKRSEFTVTINIPGRIDEIKAKLGDLILSNEKVQRIPAPKVLLTNFSNDSSEFRISYWTDIGDEDEVRSDVMFKIEEKIARANTEMNS